jgi:uncharacterized protein YqfA (UPF0365 family)
VEEGCSRRVRVRRVDSHLMNASLSASKIVAWETDMTQAEVGDAAGGEADAVVDAAVMAETRLSNVEFRTHCGGG